MDKSAFRVLFAAAWAFPGVLAAGLPFLPESPYPVLKGRHDEALRSLQRLSGAHEDIHARLLQIQKTVEAERQMTSSEDVSFAECFLGTNWRRTRIILICSYMPQVVGSVLSSNAPYFLNQTGLDSQTVIMLVQIGVSMGVVSALVTSSAVAGEVSSTRLRAKSLGLGMGFQAVAGTFWTVAMPYLFNQDQANLGGNIGWIFFGMGLLILLVLYLDVPGTKGRSYEELDTMFEKQVPARHLEKYRLD